MDPSTGHVDADEGDQVSEFESSGATVGNPIGAGEFSESFSFAASGGGLVVANPHDGNVVSFGTPMVPESNPTDSPMVLDALRSSESRRTADFQATPSGAYAVFPSAMPLTGYDNAGHREIYRYEAGSGELDCASCNSTGEQATGEASLAPNGLSLTDDGRVFFNAKKVLWTVTSTKSWMPMSGRSYPVNPKARCS